MLVSCCVSAGLLVSPHTEAEEPDQGEDQEDHDDGHDDDSHRVVAVRHRARPHRGLLRGFRAVLLVRAVAAVQHRVTVVRFTDAFFGLFALELGH